MHIHQRLEVFLNSGFLISTILIRISFSVTGVLNNMLIVSAVLFGLLLFYIHNQFEKKVLEEA